MGQMSLEHHLWYLCTELTEIWDFWSFTSYLEGRQTFKWVQNTICDTELIDIWDFLSFTSFSCYKP